MSAGSGAAVAAALREAAAALAAVSDTPRLDAELLMADALGCTRDSLLLARMAEPAPPGFAPRLARRLGREPVAHITGRAGFWDMELAVTPDVLVPRADSETLIEAARDALSRRPPARICDLGTGSGCLLLAALRIWPEAQGTGIDRSAAALAVAARNAETTGIGPRATLLALDWTAADWVDGLGGPFDLVLANPPYVETGAPLAPEVARHEPAGALFAGPDGLDAYRLLLPALPGLMAPGGIAVLECGAGQAAAVLALAAAAGLSGTGRRDLGGHERALVLHR